MYKSKKSAKDEKLPDIEQNDIFNMAKQIMKDTKLVLKKKKNNFLSPIKISSAQGVKGLLLLLIRENY